MNCFFIFLNFFQKYDTIKSIKGNKKIKKEFPIIKSKLWKEYFWSRSFLVLRIGGASIEVIKTYIQGQGEEDEDS